MRKFARLPTNNFDLASRNAYDSYAKLFSAYFPQKPEFERRFPILGWSHLARFFGSWISFFFFLSVR